MVGIAVDGPILVVDSESPGDTIGASTAEPSGRLFAGCGICSGLPIESVDTGGILDSPAQSVSVMAAAMKEKRVTHRHCSMVLRPISDCGHAAAMTYASS